MVNCPTKHVPRESYSQSQIHAPRAILGDIDIIYTAHHHLVVAIEAAP